MCIASATLAPFPLFDWPPVCLRALGPLASLPSSDDTRTLCSSSLFFGFRRNFKENSFFRFFFFVRPFFALLYHGACVVGNWLGPSELGWRSLLCREEACRQCSTSRSTAACSTARTPTLSAARSRSSTCALSALFCAASPRVCCIDRNLNLSAVPLVVAFYFPLLPRRRRLSPLPPTSLSRHQVAGLLMLVLFVVYLIAFLLLAASLSELV